MMSESVTGIVRRTEKVGRSLGSRRANCRSMTNQAMAPTTPPTSRAPPRGHHQRRAATAPSGAGSTPGTGVGTKASARNRTDSSTTGSRSVSLNDAMTAPLTSITGVIQRPGRLRASAPRSRTTAPATSVVASLDTVEYVVMVRGAVAMRSAPAPRAGGLRPMILPATHRMDRARTSHTAPVRRVAPRSPIPRTVMPNQRIGTVSA